MDEIKLEQLEEMQKDLFRKQCDLDIQKAFVKHFIKKKQSEQLPIPVVVQQSEQYCECKKPTLGKSVSRCGTCDEWFKPLK